MKKFLTRNLIPVILAVLGLIASVLPIAARVRAEQNNKNYDIVLDYSDVRKMAAQSAYDEDYWLELFSGLGIDKAALYELTATDMSEDINIPVNTATASKLAGSYGWQNDYPEAVVQWIGQAQCTEDTLIAVGDLDTYDWIMNAYESRTDGFQCKTITEDGKGYIWITGKPNGLTGKDWTSLCLGMWPETVERLESHGMTVVPRTTTLKKLNSVEFAREYMNVLSDSGTPYFIASGKAIPGGDDMEQATELMAGFLNETGIRTGLIEQNDQSQNLDWEGQADLLAATNDDAVRVFNVWPYIQNRYAYCGYEGPEEITNSLFRAIVERNCNVIYMKMILEPDTDASELDPEKQAKWQYITEPEDYIQLFTDLDARMSAQGYELGTVPALEMARPSTLVRVIEGLGVIGLVVLLLDMFFLFSNKWRYGLLIAGCVCAAGCAVAAPGMYKLLLCIAAGVALPSIAGVGLARSLAWRRQRGLRQPKFGGLLGYTIVSALITIAVALCGSVMASAALSELSFMLEIDLYRGVKLMQLIPIALFAAGYLLVFAYEDSGAKAEVVAHIGHYGEPGRSKKVSEYWRELMDKNVKLGWIVFILAAAFIAVLLLAVGVYYIYRTGNSMNVSSAELQFRNILENLLAARPRTKEFVIGWPCLMLFVWSVRRHVRYLPFLFGMGMSIGLVSIVNTFLHIRTPFLFSLLRSGWGALFGVLIGIALVLIAELIYHLITKHNGRAENV